MLFYFDLRSSGPTHFSRKDTTSTPFVCLFCLPPLIDLLAYMFQFSLSSVALHLSHHNSCGPWRTSRLPAGRTQRPAGISGWQPENRFGFSHSSLNHFSYRRQKLNNQGTQLSGHGFLQWKISSFCTFSAVLFISAVDLDLQGCGSARARVELH